MKKSICFLGATIIICFSVFGHSSEIRRITLAQLQKKADIIVLAEVTDVKAEKNIDTVTIKVGSYLKGGQDQTMYTFTLVTRGGLKDFDPALKKGDTGVFFLKSTKRKGEVKKAYWGSIATFTENNFEVGRKEKGK